MGSFHTYLEVRQVQENNFHNIVLSNFTARCLPMLFFCHDWTCCMPKYSHVQSCCYETNIGRCLTTKSESLWIWPQFENGCDVTMFLVLDRAQACVAFSSHQNKRGNTEIKMLTRAETRYDDASIFKVGIKFMYVVEHASVVQYWNTCIVQYLYSPGPLSILSIGFLSKYMSSLHHSMMSTSCIFVAEENRSMDQQ